MSKMLTVTKVAKLFGVTTYTVRHWIKTGKVKAVKIPDTEKAQWFISQEEADRLARGSDRDELKED